MAVPFDPPQPRFNRQQRAGDPALFLIGRAPVLHLVRQLAKLKGEGDCLEPFSFLVATRRRGAKCSTPCYCRPQPSMRSTTKARLKWSVTPPYDH